MITYEISPKLSNEDLSDLFENSWNEILDPHYANRLTSECIWVVAYDQERLVGFVKVVSDGGKHGFVLDTTTHTDYRNCGVGTELLQRLSAASKEKGIEWLHVDFEAKHTKFYRNAGFEHTEAGVKNLKQLKSEYSKHDD